MDEAITRAVGDSALLRLPGPGLGKFSAATGILEESIRMILDLQTYGRRPAEGMKIFSGILCM